MQELQFIMSPAATIQCFMCFQDAKLKFRFCLFLVAPGGLGPLDRRSVKNCIDPARREFCTTSKRNVYVGFCLSIRISVPMLYLTFV